jgi:hypothetical protein
VDMLCHGNLFDCNSCPTIFVSLSVETEEETTFCSCVQNYRYSSLWNGPGEFYLHYSFFHFTAASTYKNTDCQKILLQQLVLPML